MNEANVATRVTDSEGRYLYWCADCGTECTMGTPAGPATRALDGKTRCRECEHKRSVIEHRLNDAAPALLAACHDAEARILAMLHGEPMKHCSETLKILRRAIMKAEASR